MVDWVYQKGLRALGQLLEMLNQPKEIIDPRPLQTGHQTLEGLRTNLKLPEEVIDVRTSPKGHRIDEEIPPKLERLRGMLHA